MLTWDKLRIFHIVASAGSFTNAGRILSVSQSSISRHIMHLENTLDTSLFYRHSRGLNLTEKGEILYQTVNNFSKDLIRIKKIFDEDKLSVCGSLSITTTVAFGSIWLMKRIDRFSQLNKEVLCSVLLHDGELDLAMREADIAVCFQETRYEDSIQQKLGNFNFKIYASRAYLKQYKPLKNFQDLGNHRLIGLKEENSTMLPLRDLNFILYRYCFQEGMDCRPVYMYQNNVYGVFRAVSEGIGIGVLPEYFEKEEAELVNIFPDELGPQISCYFVYPQELRTSCKVLALKEFLTEELKCFNI